MDSSPHARRMDKLYVLYGVGQELELYILVKLTNLQYRSITLVTDVYSMYVEGYMSERYLNIFKDHSGKFFHKQTLVPNLIERVIDLESNYNNLPNRFHTDLGLYQLNQAIQELSNDYHRSWSKNLLIVIQMIPEAARFPYESKKFGSLCKNWGKCKALSIEHTETRSTHCKRN